jgi:long-chain acyl-CoA synthetase
MKPDELGGAAWRCYRALGAGNAGSTPWLVTDSLVLSHAQLQERIGRVGALLRQRGIGMGARVVVASRDDAESAQLFIALVCHGVTAINLDADTGEERAAALIAKADPALLIADRELVARWSLATQPRPCLVISKASASGLLGKLMGKAAPAEGLHAELAALEPVAPPAEIPPETLAYILFTSGTTQQPKGVCISHRALFSHLHTLSRHYGYDSKSRILNTLMLSHADGMIQGPVMAFFTCATVYRPLRFEVTTVADLLDAVYQLRISHMIAVPTMLSLMLRLGQEQRDAFRGGDFRLMVSCGAQLEGALQTAFVDMFAVPLVNVYGLTETVVGGVFAGPDAGSGQPGSIGRPVDCELRLADADGRELPPGEDGELLMRGDLLMSGYFGGPELTAAVLRDGWLHTGDIASRDEAGNFRICGRAKNIIIRGGYNIHPEEIAEVLQRHPQVREAIAFGLPDPVWGETVAALVVAADELDIAALQAFCATQLEPRKLPSRLQQVAALPRGRSGKVLLEEARTLLEAVPAEVAEVSREAVAERLLQVAARCFKLPRERVSLASTPADVMGWDSLAHMELVVAIEEEFGVQLSARDIMALNRIDKALAWLPA